eukprot:scaffold109064_cov33-Phaeocystis_antarctica.AAC.1
MAPRAATSTPNSNPTPNLHDGGADGDGAQGPTPNPNPNPNLHDGGPDGDGAQGLEHIGLQPRHIGLQPGPHRVAGRSSFESSPRYYYYY